MYRIIQSQHQTQKSQKEFIDTGFGFPVHLLNVPVVNVRGVWTPKINYKELSKVILQILVVKSECFTGSELKFIRTSLQIPRSDFGNQFGIEVRTLQQWEDEHDRAIDMDWTIEEKIRLYIHNFLADGKELESFDSIRKELQKKYSTMQRNEIDVNQQPILLAA